MRHGLRLDRDPRASWADREARPYDTPLADGALPAAAADALRPLGLATIASSPFRRCLQTSGAVARGLGVAGVRVSSDLGELMVAVRRDAPACGRLEPLDDAAVAAALGDGVALAARGGDGPPWDEAPDDGARRLVTSPGPNLPYFDARAPPRLGRAPARRGASARRDRATRPNAGRSDSRPWKARRDRSPRRSRRSERSRRPTAGSSSSRTATSSAPRRRPSRGASPPARSSAGEDGAALRNGSVASTPIRPACGRLRRPRRALDALETVEDARGEASTSAQVAYDVPECGFLAFDASAGLDGAAAILAADRVLLLDGAASDGSDGSDGGAGSDGSDGSAGSDAG